VLEHSCTFVISGLPKLSGLGSIQCVWITWTHIVHPFQFHCWVSVGCVHWSVMSICQKISLYSYYITACWTDFTFKDET